MMKIFFIALLIVSPFFFLGLLNKVKAIWAGREGAPLLQPYYDFFRLLKKGEVISKTTSIVFKLSPSINVAAVLFALLMIPIPGLGSIIHFEGDFVYLLTLLRCKIFYCLPLLDTAAHSRNGCKQEASSPQL